jgi:hypothetical protein
MGVPTGRKEQTMHSEPNDSAVPRMVAAHMNKGKVLKAIPPGLTVNGSRAAGIPLR